jgi:hypothetical protein
MRIQIELSERDRRTFEKIAASLNSIDLTLKMPPPAPEDFSEEAASVKATTADVMSAEHAVHDAQERIPH